MGSVKIWRMLLLFQSVIDPVRLRPQILSCLLWVVVLVSVCVQSFCYATLVLLPTCDIQELAWDGAMFKYVQFSTPLLRCFSLSHSRTAKGWAWDLWRFLNSYGMPPLRLSLYGIPSPSPLAPDIICPFSRFQVPAQF